MKSKIMKRAWRIAKDAAKKFGGIAKEYLSISMKIAWSGVEYYYSHDGYRVYLDTKQEVEESIKYYQDSKPGSYNGKFEYFKINHKAKTVEKIASFVR